MEPLNLENGLIVHFIDMSSPPVAGRCKVRLVIRVPVEPVEEHFSSYPNPSGALQQFISLAVPVQPSSGSLKNGASSLSRRLKRL